MNMDLSAHLMMGQKQGLITHRISQTVTSKMHTSKTRQLPVSFLTLKVGQRIILIWKQLFSTREVYLKCTEVDYKGLKS